MNNINVLLYVVLLYSKFALELHYGPPLLTLLV